MRKSTLLKGHILSIVRVYVVLLLSGITLVACGGGSDKPDDSTDDPALSDIGEDDQNVLGVSDDVPVGEGEASTGNSMLGDPEAEADRIGLVVDSSQRCAVVFEPLEVVITRQLAEGEALAASDSLPNITGLILFDQSLGSSLELVSRNDAAAIFRMNAQDIVALTASFENGSVTTYMAGYEADMPDSFIMRKPVGDGCLYAFKSENDCVTGLSRSGSFSVSRNGVSMSAIGCELQNPDNLPVIELP